MHIYVVDIRLHVSHPLCLILSDDLSKPKRAAVRIPRHNEVYVSSQFEGSVPDGVTEIFHLHNPSGCTIALGSTQPLTEMSTRNISWGVNAAGA